MCSPAHCFGVRAQHRQRQHKEYPVLSPRQGRHQEAFPSPSTWTGSWSLSSCVRLVPCALLVGYAPCAPGGRARYSPFSVDHGTHPFCHLRLDNGLESSMANPLFQCISHCNPEAVNQVWSLPGESSWAGEIPLHPSKETLVRSVAVEGVQLRC